MVLQATREASSLIYQQARSASDWNQWECWEDIMPYDCVSDTTTLYYKQKNLYFSQKFQWRTGTLALYFSDRNMGAKYILFHIDAK